jgi:GrpB-like predicted nucleotidyltransferase (UPF0157 family)
VLNHAIAQYAETRPIIGSIECSVITLETAQNVPDEMPFELHYSESCLNDAETYGERKVDPDLQAHLMCVKKCGVCLYGKEIDEVFGTVSWENFMLAILGDFDWIAADENICESPYYGILNICRNLQLFWDSNRKYLSKYEGATWAIENLPVEYKPLIEKALSVYCSDAIINERERRTSGVDWDKASLLAFRNYARAERQKYDEERRAQIYPVIMSNYKPAWPEWFAEEKANLERLIGVENIIRISHIGSTAVPGLTAKPTVDILLEINDSADIDIMISTLSTPDYTCLKDEALTMPTPPPHLMFLKGYLPNGFADKVYHIHVRYCGDWDELHFRNYLVAHPETAAEYAEIKKRLLQDFQHDRDGYTVAKSNFVKDIMKKAKYGL